MATKVLPDCDGNDALTGSAGADRFAGGTDNDILTRDPGDDLWPAAPVPTSLSSPPASAMTAITDFSLTKNVLRREGG